MTTQKKEAEQKLKNLRKEIANLKSYLNSMSSPGETTGIFEINGMSTTPSSFFSSAIVKEREKTTVELEKMKSEYNDLKSKL